jgi:hypothetical protein
MIFSSTKRKIKKRQQIPLTQASQLIKKPYINQLEILLFKGKTEDAK